DQNERGLNIRFTHEDGRATATFTPSEEFEGYRGILHGGILSTLLDEVMIHAILSRGILTFTTRIEVRFKKPAHVGRKLFLEGTVTRMKRKIIEARGQITDETGTLIAEASGCFYRTESPMKSRRHDP
ncbi:MAG: PaaI family thioesterase, partial [Candidatus Aminicenantales bacterium]